MKTPAPFHKLISGKNLSARESEKLFRSFFKQELTENDAKSTLLLLAKKGETADELLGCVKALRKLEPPLKHKIKQAIDTCGTGGDGSHSLNVSTLSAFVIAGAGGKVAKHGNRSITSKCGSSDLLTSLGIKLDAKPKKMIQAIQSAGIGYFHAPFYHPVFAKVQPLRKKLGVRTIFNLLGPLVNPLGVNRQIVGVARSEYLKLYATVLKKKGVRKALVCHSHDGLDEISTRAKSTLAWVSPKKITIQTLDPQKLGFKRPGKDAFKGGSPQKNAIDAMRLLKGQLQGPKKDIVILNAAAGLVVSDLCKNIRQGIKLATESIDSGSAYQSFLKLKKGSR